MLKKFVFSCETFGGFEVILSVQPLDTLENLTQQCVNKLKTFLKEYHLELLNEQLKKKQYHIHSDTMETICGMDRTVYVCACIEDK